MVVRLAALDGSAPHPHLLRLVRGGPAQRNLSDAVHALCAVHGHYPGMVEDALNQRAQPEAHDWLAAVADGFAAERGYLVQLLAAVGPLPSTPGQSETATALIAERQTLAILARSERKGCATGAVAALLCDWTPIRRVLDVAALRFGIEAQPTALPPEAETARTIATLGDSPSVERAIAFGAQQLFAQHRGLWSLLEARSSARGDL
ncbi:hypothetical protein U1701_13675 [Sphingomonas sp. PB2P19]|uniref:DUF6975 family protein n=1 Tax=Sphingomonas rhamnosi TaxID=3096156 RepID=UPI002FC96015